jgi:HEPN domain-containing protein
MNSDPIQIDVKEVIRHWTETSDDDFRTMYALYNSKSYHWALFLGHITIEKLLKAYYVKIHRSHAPFTHNLYRLAELCELELTDELKRWLVEVTTFNLEARYDDYKRNFYQLCTAAYTAAWIEKIEILRKWIKGVL